MRADRLLSILLLLQRKYERFQQKKRPSLNKKKQTMFALPRPLFSFARSRYFLFRHVMYFLFQGVIKE